MLSSTRLSSTRVKLSFTRETAIALTMALIAAQCLVTARGASAQQAAGADDRCTGHLCDMYYGVVGSNNAPQRPSAQQATPAQSGGSVASGVPEGSLLGRLFTGGAAPQTAAAPAAPQAPVQGSGVIAMLKGAKAERCGGTICDLYYGSPSPEEIRAQQAEAGIVPQPQAAAPLEGVQTARSMRALETVERRERQRCAASGRDPWSCYR